MKPTRRAVALGLSAAALAGPVRAAPAVTVHKDPQCGCCGAWAAHLRRAGFAVTETPTADMEAVKARAGVPDALRSCHTAFVDGFVLEGHVPAELVERLLRERPSVIGLAVPGMPMGSPGMEGPEPEPYDGIAFDRSGASRIFQAVRPRSGG